MLVVRRARWPSCTAATRPTGWCCRLRSADRLDAADLFVLAVARRRSDMDPSGRRSSDPRPEPADDDRRHHRLRHVADAQRHIFSGCGAKRAAALAARRRRQRPVADRRHLAVHHHRLLRRVPDRRAAGRPDHRQAGPVGRSWCRRSSTCSSGSAAGSTPAHEAASCSPACWLSPPPAAPAQPPRPPRLIVAISVDQFSADLFAEYRQHFTGGLRRLSQGAVFPAGYQAHAATETCPGHSTILTGSRPARTGIIANNWFDLGAAREDKYIYCSEDERVPGSTSRELHRLALSSARAGARRSDAPRRSAQPHRRRRRQGPGGDDDGRP